MNAVLEWESDKVLRVNDVKFYVTFDGDEFRSVESTEQCFLLAKGRPMVERSAALAQAQRIARIFEIGIYRGGSMVLYDQLYTPEKIAAVDIRDKPVDALTKYIATRGKSESMRPYYGVDQADREAMERILAAEFPQRDLDLIVDDASHDYRKTRASFNICFPYLKPGGRYVIEDWGWAHWSGGRWQIPWWQFWKRPPYGGGKALSNLLVELAMLAASRPGLIEETMFNHNLIIIRKGQGRIPPGPFNLGDHYLLRGKRFRPWL